MDWTIITQESPRLGRITQFLGEGSKEGGWQRVHEALVEFWTKLISALRQEYSGSRGPDWEVLNIEMWPDSGRVIGYPGLRSPSLRIDRVTIQLYLLIVEEEYFRLPDGRVRPDAFEMEHGRLMLRLADEITAAAKSPNVAPRLAELVRWHPAEVRILWYSDRETAEALDQKEGSRGLRGAPGAE